MLENLWNADYSSTNQRFLQEPHVPTAFVFVEGTYYWKTFSSLDVNGLFSECRGLLYKGYVEEVGGKTSCSSLHPSVLWWRGYKWSARRTLDLKVSAVVLFP